jgi:hypothetical protein
MQDVVREPVVLIDEDLDAIAGGSSYDRGVDVRVSLRNSPIQVNESINEVSTGNNNNNGGNQRIS